MECENSFGSWWGRKKLPQLHVKYEHVHRLGGDCFRSVCITRLTCCCSKYMIYKANGMLQNTDIKGSSNTDGGVERMKSLSALHANRSGDWTAHSSQFNERTNYAYTHSVTVRTSFVSIYTCDITIFLGCLYEYFDTRLREQLKLCVLRIQFFLDVTLWRKRKEQHKKRRSVVSRNTWVLEYIAVRTSELTSRCFLLLS